MENNVIIRLRGTKRLVKELVIMKHKSNARETNTFMKFRFEFLKFFKSD